VNRTLSNNAAAQNTGDTQLLPRIEGEYREMPGLSLTVSQVERLWGLDSSTFALRRLNEDTYGVCFGCGAEITERRLRALSFAVRCKGCEEARETAEQRERITARRDSSSRVVEMSS